MNFYIQKSWSVQNKRLLKKDGEQDQKSCIIAKFVKVGTGDLN